MHNHLHLIRHNTHYAVFSSAIRALTIDMHFDLCMQFVLWMQIHLMGLGTASSFLEKVLQPPPQKSVAAAVAMLREVGQMCADVLSQRKG
jgi:hypothetical protein